MPTSFAITIFKKLKVHVERNLKIKKNRKDNLKYLGSS